MYYVYVLESIKDGSWYIGYSTDIKQRILTHKSGNVRSTKHKLPIKLIYLEAYLNRLDAKKREQFLKSGSGRRFLKTQLRHYLSSNRK